MMTISSAVHNKTVHYTNVFQQLTKLNTGVTYQDHLMKLTLQTDMTDVYMLKY